jgi:hypothetical protein
MAWVCLLVAACFIDTAPDTIPDTIAETPTAEASKEGGQVVFPLAPRADEPAVPIHNEKGGDGAIAAPPAPQPRILRYERRCINGVCQNVPVYEESVDQAAAKLQGWRDLPEQEAKRLSAIVDGPAIAKALRQEYDIASCGMVCASHGSKLYDVFEDGTVQLAKEQPASGENQGYRGIRLFRRRR